jgi:hypothetical protein
MLYLRFFKTGFFFSKMTLKDSLVFLFPKLFVFC